eukprot:15344823-Ditylum_brightwellii.AAC.1
MATEATLCMASAISAIVNAPNHKIVVCIGIVTTGTIIFTFAQPYFALLVEMVHSIAGSWIGGSIDHTQNAIASTAIISYELVLGYFICSRILTTSMGQEAPEGEALQYDVHNMGRWWFSIAFVALGISSNLKDIYKHSTLMG